MSVNENEMENELLEVDTIYIPAEDGGEIFCAILGDFECDGSKYYLLAEIMEDDSLAEQVWLYGYDVDDEGIMVRTVEDDEMAKVTKYCEEHNLI